MEEHVEKLCKEMQGKMNKIIGYISSDLECRFSKIRTEETNCANFIADMMRM